MDGYFADPEGEPGKPFDWDKPGLDALAQPILYDHQIRGGIKTARSYFAFSRQTAVSKTSLGGILCTCRHSAAAGILACGARPVHHANPQRTTAIRSRHGSRPEARETRFNRWRRTNSLTTKRDRTVRPGANNQGVNTLHFYTDEPGINPGVWNALPNCDEWQQAFAEPISGSDHF
jgi:hypothetical protein